MEAEHIAQLIFKHLKGVQTAEEDRMVNSWRKAHPTHEKLFQRLSHPHYIRETLGTLDYYKNTGRNITDEEIPEITEPLPSQVNWLFPALVAAVILLMISTGMVTLFTPIASGRTSHQPMRTSRFPLENRTSLPASR